MSKQTKFTIEEIKNYVQSQDSLGDVLYNLKEENVINANKVKNHDDEDLDSELGSAEDLLEKEDY